MSSIEILLERLLFGNEHWRSYRAVDALIRFPGSTSIPSHPRKKRFHNAKIRLEGRK